MSTLFNTVQKTAYCLTALGAMACAAIYPGLCAPQLDQTYDWNIEVETVKLKHQFEYSGSQIDKIVKSKVSYFYAGTSEEHDERHPDEDHKIEYANYWHCYERPMGMELKHEFDLDKGDGVAIRVKPKEGDGSPEEYKAAADTILRLVLQSLLNKNPVVTVKVPDGTAYDEIIDELRAKGVQDTPEHIEDHPFSSTVNIFVQETDGDRKTSLYYPS